ncbi:MAG: hypothetical protein WBN92_18845, partial [Terriglobia bacterium]
VCNPEGSAKGGYRWGSIVMQNILTNNSILSSTLCYKVKTPPRHRDGRERASRSSIQEAFPATRASIEMETIRYSSRLGNPPGSPRGEAAAPRGVYGLTTREVEEYVLGV